MYSPSSKRQTVPPTPDQAAAIADGYGQLTTSYSSMEEFAMQRAIADLVRSGIEYRLVKDEDGTQIWRKNLRKLPKH